MTREYISNLYGKIWQKKTSLDFRLKVIDETRNSLLEKIKHNDLMCEKHKEL